MPAPDTEPDYYAVLGVAPGASEEEIRRAFRRLVKLWHPDHYMHAPDAMRNRAERRMRAILRAYEAIGTPTARAAYSLRRRQVRRQTSSAGHRSQVVVSYPDLSDARIVRREPQRSAASRDTAKARTSEKTFASMLGGLLFSLLALGVAGHLVRAQGNAGLGLMLEAFLLIAFVALAAIFFIDDSSLTHAATAYFEHDPWPAQGGRRVGSDTPDAHEYV